MDEPKISVIVPVYKVEPYLRKCLDSIVGQTYRNLEIILVDDGSPDNCGEICDEYAERDERIRVIHKKNGGLSSARNAGLKLATGLYIGFVDSDDWIESDMYEYLLKGAQRSGSDITMCSFSSDTKTSSQKVGYRSEQLLNNSSAMWELLKDAETSNNVWNKLFRRELIEGIFFPEGRVYEDISVMYRLYERTRTVLVRPEIKYHYLCNPAGIMMSKNIQYKLDYWTAVTERYQYMMNKAPEYEPVLINDMVGAISDTWSVIWPERKKISPDCRQIFSDMAQFARRNYWAVLQKGNFGITGKFRLLLTPHDEWWAFFLAYLLRCIYESKHN